MPHTITSLTVAKSSRSAQVRWEDGTTGEFSVLMLRDNCFCNKCYSPAVGERVKLTASISPDTAIRSAKIQNGGVVIQWNDGHVSKYDANWLRQNIWSDRPPQPEFSPKPWTASIADSLPRFSHNELLADDRTLLQFLSEFRDYGISLVYDVPSNANEVEKFANQIAYVREIIFDRVADIRVSEDGYTQGFTSAALQPHTDCSGYRWPPNVFLFHCLANNVVGGESVYVDGQAVVEQLREERPEYLRFLTKTRTTFRLFSKTADTTTTASPVILDEWGNLDMLRYANWAVQPIRMSLLETEYYYTAYNALSRLIHSPDNQLIVKVRPGEMMVVNNHRILHGRKEFRPETGGRHFQQVYMEVDDLLGRIRVLRQTLAAPS